MQKNMNCPKCHSELVKGEHKRFVTLVEHVSDPNKRSYPLRQTFVCSNHACPTTKEDIFWDSDGAMYGFNKNFKFENDINSAYPSFERKMDIEIYKKGLRKDMRLSPILTLGFLKPMIEFTYQSDDYGNVVKKGYKLCWLKKESFNPFSSEPYCIYYIFPTVILYKHITGRFRDISQYRECTEKYKESFKKELLEPLPSWDKRWWRKVEKWLDKKVFYRFV
jgi:hypothetical protein